MMVKDHEKLSALSHEHAIFNANLVHAFFPLPRYTTAALIQDANHSIYFFRYYTYFAVVVYFKDNYMKCGYIRLSEK